MPLYFQQPAAISFNEQCALAWSKFKNNYSCFIEAACINKQADDIQVAISLAKKDDIFIQE
jgi:hypothetical protein